MQGLPVGTYEAVLETVDEAPDVEQAQQAKPRRSVSVRRGGRPTRTIFNIRAQQRQRGDLLIRVRDQDGSYLAGACFGLIPNGETAPSAEVRQPRRRREQRRRSHPPHQHPGWPVHADPDDRSHRLLHSRGSVGPHRGGLRARGAVTNQAEPERTATSTSRRLTARNAARACYAIMRGNSTLEACDDDDDGITRFADIPSGSYVVRQIQPPAGGYTAAGSTATRLDPGQTATVTVVNEARPAAWCCARPMTRVSFWRACFALRSGDRVVYSICDNDASDANTSVGVILLGTVAPGTYTLRETQPPIGYLGAADQEVTISANQRSQISVVNAWRRNRSVLAMRVFKLDTGGRALAGSCLPLSTAEVRCSRCAATRTTAPTTAWS